VAKSAVHLILKEVGGHRYLLCDTRGNNLYSTASLCAVSCERCITRWNNICNRWADVPLQVIQELEELLQRKQRERL